VALLTNGHIVEAREKGVSFIRSGLHHRAPAKWRRIARAVRGTSLCTGNAGNVIANGAHLMYI